MVLMPAESPLIDYTYCHVPLKEGRGGYDCKEDSSLRTVAAAGPKDKSVGGEKMSLSISCTGAPTTVHTTR